MRFTKTLGFGSISYLLSFVFIHGCADTRTGNPGEVNLVVTSSNQSFNVASIRDKFIFKFDIMKTAVAATLTGLLDSQGRDVTITNAWIALENIEFKLDTTDTASDAENEIKFIGPYYVDLLADSPTVIDTQSIALNTYKRIKFKLHANVDLPTGVPSGMSERSIYLVGTVNGHTFTYSPKDETEAEIFNTEGVKPDAGQDLLLVFNFKDLIENIDLAAITSDLEIWDDNKVASTDACPNLSPGAEDLFKCFREGIETQSKFGKDSDGDDEID